MAVRQRERFARELGLVVVVTQGEGLGFRLAGVDVEEVAPGDEARALHAIRDRPGVGVIAAEQMVLDAAEPAAGRRRLGDGIPVVIPFTLPRRWAEPGHGRELVAAIVRRAVGYHVKLGGGRT